MIIGSCFFKAVSTTLPMLVKRNNLKNTVTSESWGAKENSLRQLGRATSC